MQIQMSEASNYIVVQSLIFSDEFDSLSLDPAGDRSGKWGTYWYRWNTRLLSGNSDDAYKAHDSHVGTGSTPLSTVCGGPLHEVVGGVLSLYGRQIPVDDRQFFSGFPYAAGMISTELSFYRSRLEIEFRMRCPSFGKGHHIAAWLIYKNGDWPPEIDVVEIVGETSTPSRLYMNAHGTGAERFASGNTYYNGTVAQEQQDPWTPSYLSVGDALDWHTYKCVVTDEWVDWYIDGLHRRRMANFLSGSYYLSQPVYFIISPEIAGTWAGDPDGTTTWPMQVDIDYIRVNGSEIAWAGENWSGASNGDPWPVERWSNAESQGTGLIDVQSAEGRIVSGGSSFAYSRIISDQDIQSDMDFRIKFRFNEATAQRYFSISVRSNGLWSTSFNSDPNSGYKFFVYDDGTLSELQFRKVVANVRGTPVAVSKAWGTSSWILRIQLVGTAIRAKAWNAEQAEPGAWDIDEIDSEFPDGAVMLSFTTDSAGATKTFFVEEIY